MSGECQSGGEHAVDCGCSWKRHDVYQNIGYYFVVMFFDKGYVSSPLAVSSSIMLSSKDPVLELSAEKLSGGKDGVMILFGRGTIMAFKYQDNKLRKMR